MYARLALVTWKPGAAASERRDAIRRLTDAAPPQGLLVAAALQPNRNGGDLLWRHHGPVVAQAPAVETILSGHSAIAHVDDLSYVSVRSGDAHPGRSGGLYRVLALAVDPGTPAEVVERFEHEMLAMPSYVPSILRWNLARVVDRRAARAFTHVWEQEFADLSSFRGDYMDQPYHWGHLDRWFDADNPARIVDPYLCNSFCPIERPVLPTLADAGAS